MAAAKKAAVALKAVKQITLHFCPFESNVQSTRQFLATVASEKVRSTNMKCEIKSMVKHDKSEPFVDVEFVDGERLVMKGANLTCQEMVDAFKLRCLQKDPQGKAAAQK